MKQVLLILVLPLVLGCMPIMAQKGIRQRSPVYTPGAAYKNSGWLIGAGITYMLPEHRVQSLTMYRNDADGGDTLYNGDYKRKGKVGAYLEFGKHHFISDRFLLHHLDYGIHGKWFRGREQFNGTAGNSPVLLESKSKYGDVFAGVFGNASNVITLTDRHYLMNSIGLNADFRVFGNRSAGIDYGASYRYPGFFTGQLHYKLSYIWRPESGIYVIPSIETPLFTLYPWESGKATLPYFTDRSRPFIISLRIQWLSKQDARKCEGQPGQGPSLEGAGRHGKNDLFGDQAKSMKKSKRKANKKQEKSDKKGKRKKKRAQKTGD
jgi:hypothetical protein